MIEQHKAIYVVFTLFLLCLKPVICRKESTVRNAQGTSNSIALIEYFDCFM